MKFGLFSNCNCNGKVLITYFEKVMVINYIFTKGNLDLLIYNFGVVLLLVLRYFFEAICNSLAKDC